MDILKKKIPHNFYMKKLRQEVDKISGHLNAYIAFCETNKLDAKKLRELDIELDCIRHQYSEALSRKTKRLCKKCLRLASKQNSRANPTKLIKSLQKLKIQLKKETERIW